MRGKVIKRNENLYQIYLVLRTIDLYKNGNGCWTHLKRLMDVVHYSTVQHIVSGRYYTVEQEISIH